MKIKIVLEDACLSKSIEVNESIALESGINTIADVEQFVLAIRRQMLPQVEKELLTDLQAGFVGEKNQEKERH